VFITDRQVGGNKIMFSLNADEKKLERLDEKTLGYLNEYYREELQWFKRYL